MCISAPDAYLTGQSKALQQWVNTWAPFLRSPCCFGYIHSNLCQKSITTGATQCPKGGILDYQPTAHPVRASGRNRQSWHKHSQCIRWSNVSSRKQPVNQQGNKLKGWFPSREVILHDNSSCFSPFPLVKDFAQFTFALNSRRAYVKGILCQNKQIFHPLVVQQCIRKETQGTHHWNYKYPLVWTRGKACS